MGSLGERLRREREKQGMTLDEVFSSTRINPRMLRAIEEEKFDQLPGGIFNKGFVRAYARHLNLDEQQAVDDYLSAAGLAVAVEPAATVVAALPPPVVKAQLPKVEIKQVTEARPQPVQKNGKERHAHPQASKPKLAEPVPQNEKRVETKAAKPAKPAKQRPVNAEPESPRPYMNPAERIPWGRLAFALLLIAFGVAIWGSFAREPMEQNSSRPVTTPATQPMSSAAPKIEQTAGTPSPEVSIPAAAVSPELEPVAAQAAPPVPDASNAAMPATTGSFMVVVQARQDSWVLITADGKEVANQVLGASAAKTVAAHKEIIVKVGNAGGVDILFNGKKLPSQGEPDQVKVLTFDPNGLENPVSKAPATLASRPAA